MQSVAKDIKPELLQTRDSRSLTATGKSMVNAENLRSEIIYQLSRQGITAGPEGNLYVLHYLDENGEIIEATE